MNVKVWKDALGYALLFEAADFELTDEAFDSLVLALDHLRFEHIPDGETLFKDIELDVEDKK
jgi:hypothetical protein